MAGSSAEAPLDLDDDAVAPSASATAPAAKRCRNHQCSICSEALTQPVYSLDECSHCFHKHCLQQHVQRLLKRMLASEVGCPACSATLSIRDVQRLSSSQPARGAQPPASQAAALAKRPRFGDAGGGGASSEPRVRGSGNATKRIFKELQAIQNSKPEAQGFSVDVPYESNVYVWEVAFFGFDRALPLARDLLRVPEHRIVLRASFPSNFPEAPPYIRVIRPRFQFRTGHVTIGGSICTEMLTTHKWSPSMTMESALLSIRFNMVQGGARIDLSQRLGDYSEAEAKHAFDRMVREHGWY